MYTLPSNLEFLTKLNAKQIKKHGNAISTAFEGAFVLSDDLLRQVFPNKSHRMFFYYKYERYQSLSLRIEKVDMDLDKLTPRAKKTKERLEIRKKILSDKLLVAESEALVRFKCHKYCRRKIMSLVLRESLFLAQKNKEIGGTSGASIASANMIRLRASQNEYNQAFLSTKCIEVRGKFIPLLDFIGDANKKTAELYVFSKGLEKIAKEKDFKWAFLTMTAPGYLHANPTVGRRKGRWTREKMTKAHQDLLKRWSALGKTLSNHGYSLENGDILGFRVVEPHKDGTPHWHMLIFYPRDLENYLLGEECGLFQRYFKHSKTSFEVRYGKDSASSASSYSLKYIFKSFGISSEDEKNDTEFKQKIIAIEAWRSASRSQCFQKIGVNGSSKNWFVARKISRKVDISTLDTPYLSADLSLPYRTEEESLKEGVEQYESYLATLDNYERSIVESDNFYSSDEIEPQDWRDGLSNELILHIELNGSLSDYEMGEKEIRSKNIIHHAINNDYASFLKYVFDGGLDILKEEYIDRYGAVKKKDYGVNLGSQVVIFDKYNIIDIENMN
ncbi:TPA: replication endonuclease [Vibrio parahaemolyticus]|nr:replication endonuclease [Vibrio parahaemolyticus]